MTPKEALERIKYLEANDMGRCVVDYCQEECDVVDKALTELEELKNNKIIIDKEDTKRYLNVFERKVLKQIVKEIEDNKKLSKVGAKE